MAAQAFTQSAKVRGAKFSIHLAQGVAMVGYTVSVICFVTAQCGAGCNTELLVLYVTVGVANSVLHSRFLWPLLGKQRN